MKSVPPAAPKKEASRVGQLLYRYSSALVLAVGVLLGLILLNVDHSVSGRGKISQVGAGLIASVIFAVIYTLLANREYAKLIRTEIAKTLTGHLGETLDQVRYLDKLFLPTSQYPATMDFDLRFNEDLTRDLRDSGTYFFRGTSAKYVPARLKCNHRLDKAQVILLDPRDESAIMARAADRLDKPGYEGKASPDVVAEIRNEIFVALTALFDCRNSCDIEVGFSGSTPTVRVEIFDKAVYTSLYRSPESRRNAHPETVRFGPDSQTYQIYHDELMRQFKFTSSRRLFTARDTDQELCDFMRELGATDAGPARLRELRQAYREFILPFTKSLAKIGYTR